MNYVWDRKLALTHVCRIARCHTQKKQKTDLEMSHEIGMCQKRFAHVKRDLYMSKEICTCQMRFGHVQRDW